MLQCGNVHTNKKETMEGETSSSSKCVKVVSVTPDAEKQIAYCARVSNPKNQENSSYEGLIRYCIRNHHWSVFEHAFLTLEINTSLAIATQILRHRSFTFQQFSQRYADATELVVEIPLPEMRSQDLKNRQNSNDDIPQEKKDEFSVKIKELFDHSLEVYKYLISQGVAKECARFVLPQATSTRVYMSGSLRSWIHYIDLRSANGTQKEHADIANECKAVFSSQFPAIAKALGW